MAHVAAYILARNRLDDIFWRRPKQFSDNGELVHIYRDIFRRVNSMFGPTRKAARRTEMSKVPSYSRSFPGKSGLPSSISAKMHPALHMSTA